MANGSRSFIQGCQAYHKGESQPANPYSFITEREAAIDWLNGWVMSQEACGEDA